MSAAPQAIILAAGYGSRLGQRTLDRHKCLVEVAGRPILGRTLDALCKLGIKDVCLVVGHLSDQVLSFAQAWASKLRISHVMNTQVDLTGTAYSLALGLNALDPDQETLILEADVVFDTALLESLLASRHRNVTSVAPFEPHITGSAVRYDRTGRVLDWLHQSHQGHDFSLADAAKTVNLTLLTNALCERLRAVLARVVAAQLNAPLEYGMRALLNSDDVALHAVPVGSARWFEVDTELDLEFAERLFAEPQALRVQV